MRYPAYITVRVPGGRTLVSKLFKSGAKASYDQKVLQVVNGRPQAVRFVVNGKPRKLVSTASRNGYFYTVDRVSGEHVVTSKFGTASNWANGLRPSGVVDKNSRTSQACSRLQTAAWLK